MSEITRPALQFSNPRPGGQNLIKFDWEKPNELGNAIELIQANTRFPLWNRAGRRMTRQTLDRIAEALRQNPGYEAVFVFPNLPAVSEALGFIEECGHKGAISAGLHAP